MYKRQVLQRQNAPPAFYSVCHLLHIKEDTVEQDKHTIKCGSRHGNVQCLCRHCICPTEESDNPCAVDYLKKSVSLIEDVVKRNLEDDLNTLSQHPIWNVWHELRFSLHNNPTGSQKRLLKWNSLFCAWEWGMMIPIMRMSSRSG